MTNIEFLKQWTGRTGALIDGLNLGRTNTFGIEQTEEKVQLSCCGFCKSSLISMVNRRSSNVLHSKAHGIVIHYYCNFME